MAASNIDVQVSDRFATARYTAPDNNACTVVLYSDSGRTVKVPDTDSSLFASSDQDTVRYSAAGYNVGRARQFRFGTLPKFGQTTPITASDGKNYSRTLSPATTYYYTICGTSGQFTTLTTPMGRTLPPARPIAAAGSYGWPTIDYTSRSKTYSDPATGNVFSLVELPGDDTNNLTNKTPTSVGVCPNWTSPSNLLANVADATYSGANQDKCFINGNIANSSGSITYSFDYFKFYVNGSSNGSGDDLVLNACITLDGQNCYSQTQAITLTASAGTTNCYPFGANAQACGSAPAPVNTWQPPNGPQIQYSQVYNNANFGVLIWKKGSGAGVTTLRNAKFEMGRTYTSSGFSIGNQFACGLNSVNGAAGSSYYLCEDHFNGGEVTRTYAVNTANGTVNYLGRLIMPTTTGIKTNSSSGWILISNTSQRDHTDPTIIYTIGSACADPADSGSCSKNIATSPNGASESSNTITITTTVPHNFPIGSVATMSSVGVSGYNTSCTIATVPTSTSFTCTIAASGLANSGGGSVSAVNPNGVLIKCQSPASGNSFYDVNAAGNSNFSFSRGCSMLTPPPNTLEDLMFAWDNAFDVTKFSAMHLDGIQQNYMLLSVWRGSQNSYAWQFVYNLNTNQIVAGYPAWQKLQTRWDGFHNLILSSDASDPCWVITVYHGLTVLGVGQGIYTMTLQTALNGTDAPGTIRAITVSGDPTATHADSPLMHLQVGDIIDAGASGTSTFEEMVVSTAPTAADNYTTLSVSRGYGVGVNTNNHVSVHNIGDTLTMTDTAGYHAVLSTDARPIYWNFCQDPRGNDTTGTWIIPDNSALGSGHQGQGGVTSVSGQTYRLSESGLNGYGTILATSALQPQAVLNPGNILSFPQGATFAGYLVNNGAADFQKHPTPPHNNASPASQQNWALDINGYQEAGVAVWKIGDLSTSSTGGSITNNVATLTTAQNHGFQIGDNVTVTLASDSTFNGTNPITAVTPNSFSFALAHANVAAKKVTGMALAQVGSCSAGCPGNLYVFTALNFNRKYPAQVMTAGMYPVVDISGPNSVIDGSAASNYKFCHALVADECVVGSTPGALYINAPFTAVPTSCYPNVPPSPFTFVNGICFGDWPAWAESTFQWLIDRDDQQNTTGRVLSSNMTPLLQQSFGVAAMPMPDGKYLWTTMFNDVMTCAEILVKIPPLAPDNMSRNDFIQHPVHVGGMANATRTIIEFGIDTNLFCTSRNEICVATSSTYNQSTPFYFETSEAGSYTGVSCTAGCTIVVPAISGQPLCYRVVYRNSSNVVLGTSNIMELAIQ